MTLAIADLQRLSGLLDQALDLAADERSRWLDALPDDARPLAGKLRALLARHAAMETADFAPAPEGLLTEPPAGAARAGAQVGPYRLLRELGVGGMGEVWLAARADGLVSRPVALKMPTLGLRRGVLVQRFARERSILGSLAHAHIARLYDAGLAEDGQPYLALEYVQGEPITTYCERHSLDVPARLRLLMQVMDAVQYAHANLVLHRDLKPSNVLVRDDGHAMLLDFGIAKLLQEDEQAGEATELTRLGGRALTLASAAPEQLAGGAVGIAADVWALGVLLYELLGGRRPFDAPHRAELEQQVLHSDPPRPGGLGSGAMARLPPRRSAELDTIVLKALKKSPAERYATVAAFAEDLARWLDGQPVRAAPDSWAYRTHKFMSRHRWGVSTAAAFVVTVVAAGGVALWQAREAREQTRIALTEAKTAAAVQDFLEAIFRANNGDQSDPLKARQRSAKELLDEGAARIDRELEDAPEAKFRVLQTLARMYFDMGDLERVVAMRDRQVALAPKAFGDASEAEVGARTTRANALMDVLRFDDARADLDRVAILLGRGVEVAPAKRAEYHLTLSALHTHDVASYDPERALAEADRGLALLRGLPPTRALIDALAQRATSLDALRRPREALATLQEAVARMREDPRIGRGTEVQMLWELADAHSDLGEAENAERVYREAVATAAARHGAGGDVAFWTHTVFIRFLFRESRLHEAAVLAEEAEAMLRRWPESTDKRTGRMGLLRFTADTYLRLGRLDAMAAILAAVDVGGSDALGIEGRWFLLVRRAWLETERGNFDTAAQALEQADALVVQRRLESHPFIASHHAAHLRLDAARGDGTSARARWATWHSEAAGGDLSGVHPGYVALFAEALLAAGDAGAALRTCESALAVLAQAPRRAARADAEADLHLLIGRSRLVQGDVPGALTALREAERRGAALLDEGRSPRLGRVRALLGQALLAAGDRAGARAMAANAAAIFERHPRLGPQYTEPLRRLRLALVGRS